MILNFEEWAELFDEVDRIIGVKAREPSTAKNVRTFGRSVETEVYVRGDKCRAVIFIKDRFVVKITIFSKALFVEADEQFPHIFAVRTSLGHHKRLPEHSPWCFYVDTKIKDEKDRISAGWFAHCGCKPEDLCQDAPGFVGAAEEAAYPPPRAAYESDAQDTEHEDQNDKKQRLERLKKRKCNRLGVLRAREKALKAGPDHKMKESDAKAELDENQKEQVGLRKKFGDIVTTDIKKKYRRKVSRLQEQNKTLIEQEEDDLKKIKVLRLQNDRLKDVKKSLEDEKTSSEVDKKSLKAKNTSLEEEVPSLRRQLNRPGMNNQGPRNTAADGTTLRKRVDESTTPTRAKPNDAPPVFTIPTRPSQAIVSRPISTDPRQPEVLPLPRSSTGISKRRPGPMNIFATPTRKSRAKGSGQVQSASRGVELFRAVHLLQKI